MNKNFVTTAMLVDVLISVITIILFLINILYIGIREPFDQINKKYIHSYNSYNMMNAV